MADQAARKLDISLQTEAGLRWEVLSHLELPGGSIAWIQVSPIAKDLSTALLTKELAIEETGVVAKLKVTNPSAFDILLPTDLIVDGGKQARVVERSVIVPSKASAEVSVRCVEQGRWATKDAAPGASANKFAVNAPANVGSREHLAKLKKRSYMTTQQYELEQSAVWEHVSSELHRSKTRSTTQSYVAFMDLNAARLKEARRLDIEPPEHANAIALVKYGGSEAGVWLEIFPSRDALMSIVANMVADALDPPTGSGLPSRPADPRVRANEAMKALSISPLAQMPTVEATIGEAYGLEAPNVAGQALLLHRRIAHVVASVNV